MTSQPQRDWASIVQPGLQKSQWNPAAWALRRTVPVPVHPHQSYVRQPSYSSSPPGQIQAWEASGAAPGPLHVQAAAWCLEPCFAPAARRLRLCSYTHSRTYLPLSELPS